MFWFHPSPFSAATADRQTKPLLMFCQRYVKSLLTLTQMTKATAFFDSHPFSNCCLKACSVTVSGVFGHSPRLYISMHFGLYSYEQRMKNTLLTGYPVQRVHIIRCSMLFLIVSYSAAESESVCHKHLEPLLCG